MWVEFLCLLQSHLRFLSAYNVVSLPRSSPWIDEESRFLTDACLSGVGAFFDGRFLNTAYQPFVDSSSLTIASLEMLPVTVSLKLGSGELSSQRILVRTDNQNTEITIIYWSLLHSLHSVMLARALVLCFPLRLRVASLTHTGPCEHYR